VESATISKIKILTIAPYYKWFIKGFVEGLSSSIEYNNVFYHYNRLANLANYIPFGGRFNHIRSFSGKEMCVLTGKSDNVNVVSLPEFYFIADGKNKILPKNLAKKIKNKINKENIDFDLIHSHFLWPQGRIGTELSKIFEIPHIITLHENMKHYNAIKKNIGFDNIKYIFDNGDFFIRVNKKDIPFFISEGISSNKLTSVPNGFDDKKYTIIPKETAREILALPRDKKILFNLSRLDDVKGQRYLIDAMKKIVKDNANVQCYIGGDGPLKEVLQKQILSEGLKEYVSLLGYVSDEKINYWMNASDLFVLPSLDEGNPTVMFESLGIGLPFIGTKVAGMPEIITSNEYGLLANPAHTDDLSEKIIQGLNKTWDHEIIKSYGNQFTWKKIAQDTVNLYNQVIKNY
jgi:teichuronic acid biosynthesis glycosyltransferase TuaC